MLTKFGKLKWYIHCILDGLCGAFFLDRVLPIALAMPNVTSEAGKSSRKPKPVSAFVGPLSLALAAPDQTVLVSFRPGRGARGTHQKSGRTAVLHFPVFVLAGVGLCFGFI